MSDIITIFLIEMRGKLRLQGGAEEC